MTSTTQAEKRPLRADAERNRRRILDGAQLAFKERGLGVSMDEIAERSGVGVGTVYRRFPEKELLIHALFEDRLEEFVVNGEEALAMDDAFEGLAFFIETGARQHGENRALKEILFTDGANREWLDRFRSTMIPLVQELLENAKASGQLRQDIETYDVPLIELMLATVFEFSPDGNPDAWKRMLGIVLDGLRADGGAPTALESEAFTHEEFVDALTVCKFSD